MSFWVWAWKVCILGESVHERVQGCKGRRDTEILISGWWEYSNILMFNIFLNCYNYL